MQLKVIWSEFAERQLDDIYEYYSNKASKRVAQKLVKGIISEPELLIHSPKIGQIESRLIGRETEYRYLVYKSYKIIYSISEKESLVKIADVFDTRQYPRKIRRGNSSKKVFDKKN